MRLQSLALNVVFVTQKQLITLQIAAPHGMTVSSNVATVGGEQDIDIIFVTPELCYQIGGIELSAAIYNRSGIGARGYLARKSPVSDSV